MGNKIMVPRGGVDISERIRAQQMERQQKEAAERAIKLNSISERIVEILIAEGCTPKDFGMIAEGIDRRMMAQFQTFTIYEIINHGQQPSVRTERETEQPGPGGPGEGQREDDAGGAGQSEPAGGSGQVERSADEPGPGGEGGDPGQDRAGGDAA